MFGIGFPELLVIFLVILLLFGAKKVPELARGLGNSIREFRSGMDGDKTPKKEESEADKQK